jgi:hypothetical protein
MHVLAISGRGVLMPADMDWRLQSVASKPSNSAGASPLVSASEETVISADVVRLEQDRVLAFPIPNATAMLLNASRRAFEGAQQLFAHEALRHAPRGFVQFHSNADAVDFAESLTLSIFAAYTSLECFANEWIPPWVTYKQKDRKGGDPKVLSKEEIERSLKLGEKFNVVLPHVFGIASPKGTVIWEHFVKLEQVRDRVVHMKEADRQSSGVETDTVWKALFAITSPHQTAKRLIDYFLCDTPYIPGLVFEKLRPVRPRWHVEWPQEGAG